jgi:hypothetical protein
MVLPWIICYVWISILLVAKMYSSFIHVSNNTTACILIWKTLSEVGTMHVQLCLVWDQVRKELAWYTNKNSTWMDGETLVEQNAKHTCRMRILHGPILCYRRLATVLGNPAPVCLLQRVVSFAVILVVNLLGDPARLSSEVSFAWLSVLLLHLFRTCPGLLLQRLVLPPFQNIRCFSFVKQMYLDIF